jgi:AbrB family looped-hinge helix DNA binding protein
MQKELIQIDKAGRVVIPKPLRDRFNLVPGDKLRLSVEGNGMKLAPTDPSGKLIRKGSVLVFSGEFTQPLTTAKVEAMIAEEREGRVRETAPKLGKR